MDNQSVPTNPTTPTPAPVVTPVTPTPNSVSSMPTPPAQSESRAPLWPKIVIVLLIIVACIEVGYIMYKQNSVVVVEETASVNP